MAEPTVKSLSLDLSQVPSTDRSKVKTEVGEFIIDEILRAVSTGSSPVQGETFKKLNKEYADNNKGGNRTPNLELEGDLLNALTFKNTDTGIDIGIFKSSETGKADGHNNHSGESQLPQRRFIPTNDQSFKQNINSGVTRIVNSFKRVSPDRTLSALDDFLTPTSADPLAVEFTLDDLLGNTDFIAGLLRG